MKKSKHGLFRNSSLYLWKMDHRLDALLKEMWRGGVAVYDYIPSMNWEEGRYVFRCSATLFMLEKIFQLFLSKLIVTYEMESPPKGGLAQVTHGSCVACHFAWSIPFIWIMVRIRQFKGAKGTRKKFWLTKRFIPAVLFTNAFLL